MPNVSISTTAQTNPVWERARERATAESISLSGLATKAVAAYLATTDDTITINVYRDDTIQPQPVSFKGRWLVDPYDRHLASTTGDFRVGIALTAKNRIAVWYASLWANEANVGTLCVFNDLDDAEEIAKLHGINDKQWDAAEMALRPVIWKDI